MPSRLRAGDGARFHRLVGVGGIGTGVFFALEGNHDLGRNESRPARLLDVRDYCKLHIVAHYPAVLLGAHPSGVPFHVVPVGKVGADDAGRGLMGEMAAAGMDVRFVETVAGRPTQSSVCFQYPDGSGGNLTTSASAASMLAPEDVDRASSLLDERTIALAVPEVPLPARERLLELGRSSFRVAAVATAEVPESRVLFSRADLVSLNEDEAAAVAGRPFDAAHPRDLLDGCARALTALQPSVSIVVTAGREGAFAFAHGAWTHCPALEVPVAGTAGAGDALLGGVLAALAAGAPLTAPGPPPALLGERPIASALELGVCLAGLVVSSPHTIPPAVTLDALRAFASSRGIAFGESLGRLVEEAA